MILIQYITVMWKYLNFLLILISSCTFVIQNPNAYIEGKIPTPSATQPATPDAPTGLSIISGNSQTTITWQPSLNATSYNLYWSLATGTNKTSNQILNVASPYIHTGLTNGTKYFYVVTAVGNGLESIESTESSEYAGIIDNHDGSIFVAHLNQTWQKCSDNYYNVTTDSCDAFGLPIHQYCAANNNTCDNGTQLISGDVFNTCATLTINGGGWRVPTVAELLTFYPYRSSGIVPDWHWATDAIPFQMVDMWMGFSRLPIWRNQLAYVVCVK